MRTTGFLLILAFAVGAVTAPHAFAQAPPSDDAVKAAYLVKLRHYVEWPGTLASTDLRIGIGIVGAEDVAEHLLQMPVVREQGKSGASVKRLRLGDPLTGVQILFVGDDVWSRAAPMVAQAHQQSILVVSESDSALAGGSVINFRLVDERIRFDISLDAAEKSNLKLSSQLLTLAMSVSRKK